MSKATVVSKQGFSKPQAGLMTALQSMAQLSDTAKPKGVFGSIALVKVAGMAISSEKMDLEFTIPFDDDLEPNEAEIILYNLSDNTLNQLKKGLVLTVEAGYTGDTGVIFTGFIDRIRTKQEGVDRATVIQCFDDVKTKDVQNLTYAKGMKASAILKDLLNKTGIPIAVFKPRRDWTYKDSVTVDGSLMSNIKQYSEVCGISTYISKGKLYSRYIKDGDNISFNVCEDTGLLQVEEFEEEQRAEDFTEVVTGFKIDMLLQHRIATAAIVNLKSRRAGGVFRVRRGEHVFNESESITRLEVI